MFFIQQRTLSTQICSVSPKLDIVLPIICCGIVLWWTCLVKISSRKIIRSGNIPLKTSMGRLALWAVAPSCWNHTTWTSSSLSFSCLPRQRNAGCYCNGLHSLLTMFEPTIPKSATVDQTVTPSQWKGRSWSCQGLFSAEYQIFYLLTKPIKWKWVCHLPAQQSSLEHCLEKCSMAHPVSFAYLL